MKKLELKKERVTSLSNQEMESIQGGGSAYSSNHGFTCCMCTGDFTKPTPKSQDWDCITMTSDRCSATTGDCTNEQHLG